jgi:hypothetical protein
MSYLIVFILGCWLGVCIMAIMNVAKDKDLSCKERNSNDGE